MNFYRPFVFIISLLYFFTPSFGQTNFTEGFVITNTSDTVQGWIDYQQWDKSPDEIRFKENRESAITTYVPAQIRAFYTSGDLYESQWVSIDKTPHSTNHLGYAVEGIFEKDSVFLMALVKGRMNLYYLKESGGKIHYFIQKEQGEPEELIYRRYLEKVEEREVIQVYAKYKSQLAYYMSDCPAIQAETQRVKYQMEPLRKLLVKYHACISRQYQVYAEEDNPNHLVAVFGASFGNLDFEGKNFSVLSHAKFNYSLRLSAGVGYNIFLRRNLQKWSVYNELLYRSYHTTSHYEDVEHIDLYTYNTITFEMDYIQLTNMLRYYYVRGNIKPFVNIGVANGIAIRSDSRRLKEKHFFTSEQISESQALQDIRKHDQGLVVGLGSTYKRFSGELRYHRSNGVSVYPALRSTNNMFYSLVSYHF